MLVLLKCFIMVAVCTSMSAIPGCIWFQIWHFKFYHNITSGLLTLSFFMYKVYKVYIV